MAGALQQNDELNNINQDACEGNLGQGKLQGGVLGGGLLRKLEDDAGEPKGPDMNELN